MRSEPSFTYSGRFYDGESAQAHEVVVRCSTTVIVVSAGADVLATWSYEGLLSPDPLVPGRQSRITHSSAPYARLVVEDGGFPQLIVERAPHLSRGAHRKRGLKLVVGCVAAAAGFVLLSYLFLTYAPRTVASVMPDEWRRGLGEQVLTALVRNRRECTAPEGVEALAQMSARLTRGESKPERIKVVVFDLGMVNAFALPGGLIVISHELIEKASGADGVAGVLAHEIGHVIERDSEAQLVRGLGLTLLQQIILGGGQVSETLGGVAGLVALLTYTRAAERRADTHAQRLLKQAEIGPDGLVRFFEYVKKTYGNDEGSGLGNLLKSHPGLDERIEKLKDAPSWPATPVLSQKQWAGLRDICSTNSPSAPKAEEPAGTAAD